MRRDKVLQDWLTGATFFFHNTNVLHNGEGELIVRRRSQVVREKSEYLPCRHCQGLFLPEDHYRHDETCQIGKCGANKQPVVKRKRQVTALSRMFLDGAANDDACSVSKKFKEEILVVMQTISQDL
jgi:hypothetical protein